MIEKKLRDFLRVTPNRFFEVDGDHVLVRFGKHKGTDIEDVPVDYLRWMQQEIDPLPEPVQRIINAVTGDTPVVNPGKSLAAKAREAAKTASPEVKKVLNESQKFSNLLAKRKNDAEW